MSKTISTRIDDEVAEKLEKIAKKKISIVSDTFDLLMRDLNKCYQKGIFFFLSLNLYYNVVFNIL